MNSQNFGNNLDQEKRDRIEMIGLLMMGFPNWNHGKTSKEITLASKSYYMALEDIPFQMLKDSVRNVLKEEKYLPTPLEIRERIILALFNTKPKISVLVVEMNKIATLDGYQSRFKDLYLLTKEKAFSIVTSERKKKDFIQRYLDCEMELGGMYAEWRRFAEN